MAKYYYYYYCNYRDAIDVSMVVGEESAVG